MFCIIYYLDLTWYFVTDADVYYNSGFIRHRVNFAFIRKSRVSKISKFSLKYVVTVNNNASAGPNNGYWQDTSGIVPRALARKSLSLRKSQYCLTSHISHELTFLYHTNTFHADFMPTDHIKFQTECTGPGFPQFHVHMSNLNFVVLFFYDSN